MLQKILVLLRDKRGAKYFILKEVLDGCKRHNFIALNASIAFFTLLAIVPLILLILFTLSQWLANSKFALSQIEIVTSRLLPQISDQLLTEVVNMQPNNYLGVWFCSVVYFLQPHLSLKHFD